MPNPESHIPLEVHSPEPVQEPRNELERYRCLVGHLICESLGYFTPKSALNAIRAHKAQTPFPCEWYSHISSTRGKGMFDDEALLDVNRDVLEQACRNRHNHNGHMNHYQRASSIVRREIDDEGSAPRLASWF
jgi:hypothetical protein